MAGLSSGLVISDLSDYLAPSQICIKPVEEVIVDDDVPGPKEQGAAATEIRMEVDGEPQPAVEAKSKGKRLQKAQITLNDCLACSGCITSAESVLVSLQSHTEMLAALSSDPSLVPVLSIAPQSLASLAARYALAPPAVLRGLRRFFKRELGFKVVFDTTFAREVSLLEARNEFLDRKGKAKETPILASACPGWICYAEKTHGALLPYISRVKSPQQVQGSLVKSLIAKRLGVDPTRVYHVAVMMCYDKKLEASRPDFRVGGESSKGDQPGEREVDCVLTTGEVQKLLDERGYDLRSLAMELDDAQQEESLLIPENLPGTGTASGGYLFNILCGFIDSVPRSDWTRLRLLVEPRRGNDYVDYTLNLLPTSSSAAPQPIFKGATCYGFRNLQNLVRKLARDHNLPLLRGAAGSSTPYASSGTSTPVGGKSAAAAAAAARRAARRGKPLAAAAGQNGDPSPVEKAYDYVEVMACPSGCVNGGGQIAPPTKLDAEGMPVVSLDAARDEEIKLVAAEGGRGSVRSAKEWVELVEKVYWSSPPAARGPMPEGIDPLDLSIVPFVLPLPEATLNARASAKTLLDGLGKEERERWTRTGYRTVESEEVNGLAVKW